MTFAAETESLWPLGVYFAAVLAVVAGMPGVSHLLGERHRERATGEPYESGMVPSGSPHVRFDVRFYLVALAFVIFDLEAAFLVACAISLRETDWTGFIEAVTFIAVLLAGLVYLWRIGALDWGPKPKNGKRTHPTAARLSTLDFRRFHSPRITQHSSTRGDARRMKWWFGKKDEVPAAHAAGKGMIVC